VRSASIVASFVALSDLNYGGVLSESFKQFEQRIAIHEGVPTGAASQPR
jgi:hypothetical protein